MASANVAEVLWSAAERFRDSPAVVELDAPGGERAVSYGRLRDRVAAIAGGLLASGMQPGDRVAILLHNSASYVETFFAAAAAGLVVVPLNVRLIEADYEHMLTDSGSRLLVTSADLARRWPGLSAGDWDVLEADGRTPALDVLADIGPPITAPAVCAPADVLSLMYTSGTTGSPKAVMLAHDSWSSVSRLASTLLDFVPGESTLHVAPLTHGAGFLVLPTMAVGGSNLLCRSFDAELTLQLMQESRTTGGFLVPSMIRMLLDALPPTWVPPSALRRVYYAGSPIDAGTLTEAFEAFGGRLVQSFAQMESPMFLTVLTRDDHRRAAMGEAPHLVRSAGRPVPGVTLSIVGEDLAPLAQGEAGEIVASAPHAMNGYWGRPEASASVLVDGRLRTGDVGRVDEEGYLYVLDRKKDMVITGGANVYAREVEDVLLSIPCVQDAAVIGLPDRKWGEAVTAVLVSAQGDEPTGEVVAACRRELAGYRVPKSVIWVDELPRNSYGKIMKRALREHFARGAVRADDNTD